MDKSAVLLILGISLGLLMLCLIPQERRVQARRAAIARKIGQRPAISLPDQIKTIAPMPTHIPDIEWAWQALADELDLPAEKLRAEDRLNALCIFDDDFFGDDLLDLEYELRHRSADLPPIKTVGEMACAIAQARQTRRG
ncbi:MAG: hypothetical protein LBL69_01000 [Zoogloeaceae bacterium]|jgi:hypothetical protein|nr:hypothetical protein [Zoogloeaceae bacterium]